MESVNVIGFVWKSSHVRALETDRFVVDATVYRSEHNLRAATTGLVGAGGLGLEITTAFHLFEYRQASALIILLPISLCLRIGLRLRPDCLSEDLRKKRFAERLRPTRRCYV